MIKGLKPVKFGGDWKQADKIMRENWETIIKMDKAAKAQGVLVGRYIDHPFADGAAVYQVTKETKKTCTIEVVTGIGDDWVLPAWGEKITLPRSQVLSFIKSREGLAAIFGGAE